MFVAVGIGAGYAASLFLSDGATGRARLHATPVSWQSRTLPEFLSVSAQNSLGKWQGIAKYLPRSDKDLQKLRQRLARAGYASPEAAIYYTLVEMVCPFIVGAVPLFFLSGQAAWLAAAAAVTPGSADARLTTSSNQEVAAISDVRSGSTTLAVSRWLTSNPGSRRWSAPTDLLTSPATITSMTASATWAPTSARVMRRPDPVVARPAA